ncbi:hypothetical protein JZ751_014359 [Albula glossodonta]|uniref:Uncharacterized protein n=1 Tax=Albula glossodonta TaxID=121402 RepID=A0A8T2P153_9TELE|nr:hypothetical protein JZ751_014359 [Albula glossodonta]
MSCFTLDAAMLSKPKALTSRHFKRAGAYPPVTLPVLLSIALHCTRNSLSSAKQRPLGEEGAVRGWDVDSEKLGGGSTARAPAASSPFQ